VTLFAGLDSWDRLVMKFSSQSDKESARLIDLICSEEIRHVKIGVEWYFYAKQNIKHFNGFALHQTTLCCSGLSICVQKKE
jgi:uncharacterized ferritin-like protein (DUF455 family)